MHELVRKLLEAGPAGRIVRQFEIEVMLGGSRARRYGVVNRLLAGGELIRLRRGVYLIPDRKGGTAGSLSLAANALQPGSYISFESALAFHGWIPEGVHVSLSACQGRSREFENALGLFTYTRIPTVAGRFLEGVESIDTGTGSALIATPLRAIADLAYARRLPAPARDFLVGSMRIDEEDVDRIEPSAIISLEGSFRSEKVKAFLQSLRDERRSG